MQVLESSTKVAFKNILFLTDFTEASQPAMQYAIELAQRHGAKFYAGHVRTPETPQFLEGPALTTYFNEVREQKRAEHELRELIHEVDAANRGALIVGQCAVEVRQDVVANDERAHRNTCSEPCLSPRHEILAAARVSSEQQEERDEEHARRELGERANEAYQCFDPEIVHGLESSPVKRPLA